MTRSLTPAALLFAASVFACGGNRSDDATSDDDGQAGTAGAAGSGGAASPPPSHGGGPLVGGDHGYFPATVNESDAERAFETFRADYIEDCGDNGARVLTEWPGETRSEAIGHGALLAVGWNDRALFDRLVTYYHKAVALTDEQKGAQHGLMGWRVWGDPCSFQEIDTGAAALADLNMAMALLQAECRWGGGDYYQRARALMDAIKTHMTAEVAEGSVLLPDDMNEQPGCMNASYSAPGFYRVFAKARPEHAAFWNKLADDAYVFLDLASDPSTGLVGDWSPIGSSSCAQTTTYVGYDAIRTHWRAATDYVWFGSAAAKTWLEKVTSWAADEIGTERFMDVRDGFFSDGSEALGDPGQANSAFLGAFAVGALPVSQKLSDEFHRIFLEVPAANDDGYYTVTARALYLMLAANKFSPGCY